ncbi:MAG: di-heme oxidoredictase family protein [Fuerstiella sp.]
MTHQTGYRYGLLATCVVLTGTAAAWLVSPSEAELVAEGRELFLHEWTQDDKLAGEGDGLGPVFNARSCVACHFQGGVGGGGGLNNNVTAFQVLPNRNDHRFHGGVIHADATTPAERETQENVRRMFPPVPESTRVVGGCTVRLKAFDPLLVEQINTPALYGAGLIDQISSFAINSGRRTREFRRVREEFSLKFDTTIAGKVHHHGLQGAGKFGWRGQFATLEDFVATACAVELGLTNPERAQDRPRTHQPDADAEYDMTSKQLHALVTYCRSLPRPEQVLPTDPAELTKALMGEQTFVTTGCADCHVRSIGGVDRIYSDFLLYSLEKLDGGDGYIEEPEVPLPSDMPHPDEWQTPPLWGVADSAPYFHDGGSPTLEDAIRRHAGQARNVKKRYKKLNSDDKQNVIAFLKTLRAPVSAEAVHMTDADDL